MFTIPVPFAVVIIKTIELIAAVTDIPLATVPSLIAITPLRSMVIWGRIAVLFAIVIVVVCVPFVFRMAINIHNTAGAKHKSNKDGHG